MATTTSAVRDAPHTYRMRVQSCIGTILDVHKIIGSVVDDEEFIKEFETLQGEIDKMDMGRVSEGDIALLEQATNALLCEFKAFFNAAIHGPVYRRAMN